MSFGCRGLVPTVETGVFLPDAVARPIDWLKRTISAGLAYPLSCLAVGVLLGGGVGAVVMPQFLNAAEDNGVYDVIRQSAAMQAARQRPSALPRISMEWAKGHLMRAMLTPARHVKPTRHAGVMAAPSHRAYADPDPRANAACATCAPVTFSSPAEAILNDVTLRDGDIVILASGAMVFRGDRQIPHQADEFVDFRKSHWLTKSERRQIDASLGITLKAEALLSFEKEARSSSARRAKTRLSAADTGPAIRTVR